jgi:hypothetical protein
LYGNFIQRLVYGKYWGCFWKYTFTLSFRPVYAIFSTEVKRVDVKQQKKIYDNLLKESDRKKNEERPRICLLTQPPELNFGPISYYQRKTLSFEIKNEGKSISSVEIDLHINDSKLNEGQICFINNHFNSQSSMTEKNLQSVLNEWIKMNRTRIYLPKPGQIFVFEVSNNFSNTNIARLNRQKHLDDILIVKCINGNDLFRHLQSCDASLLVIAQIEVAANLNVHLDDHSKRLTCSHTRALLVLQN